MIQKRILATLRFFDLQQYPLTLFEVHKFLLTDVTVLKEVLNDQYELVGEVNQKCEPVDIATVHAAMDLLVSKRLIGMRQGFYFLPGRGQLVHQRLRNYYYGTIREKRIRTFIPVLRYFPFVRGVAIAGSQALGLQRPTSDIDLFVITNRYFLWFVRLLITLYFQVLGIKRTGKKIANRICLNHYLSRPRQMVEHRNIYTAMEYVKLRAVVNESVLFAFQYANQSWIRFFFPNWDLEELPPIAPQQPGLQAWLEGLLKNKMGHRLESRLKKILLPRIKTEKYIVVRDDELSFHPHSKQEDLLSAFFEFYEQQNGETVELIV